MNISVGGRFYKIINNFKINIIPILFDIAHNPVNHIVFNLLSLPGNNSTGIIEERLLTLDVGDSCQHQIVFS